jgi:glycolate oxidase iron-sulfur subunit
MDVPERAATARQPGVLTGQVAPRPDGRGADRRLRAVPELDRCVHCGLCLNHCPTYQVTRLEPESPRGRIHLVRAAAEGRIDPGERFAQHLYLCLMCRACETACPSGVQYGRIAEAARAVLGPPGSPLARRVTRAVLVGVLSFPARVRLAARALGLAQRAGLVAVARVLPGRVGEMAAMLPAVPRQFFVPATEVFPARGPVRARVGMLSGCVMSTLFADVDAATVRVLQDNGCEVVVPRSQVCCGALHVHNGEATAARRLARANVAAFLAAGVDAVVVNAAGCGAAMKEYGHLLADDPGWAEPARRLADMVADITEFLIRLGPLPPPGRVDLTVTYQDPCHLVHGQRVRAQPRQLLGMIAGLRLVEMDGSDRCCGSAGIYTITHPQMSQTLLREKMQAIRATAAQAVVAPNPGCMLQLAYGARRYGPALPVYHLVDLLDRAYRANGADGR